MQLGMGLSLPSKEILSAPASGGATATFDAIKDGANNVLAFLPRGVTDAAGEFTAWTNEGSAGTVQNIDGGITGQTATVPSVVTDDAEFGGYTTVHFDALGDARQADADYTYATSTALDGISGIGYWYLVVSVPVGQTFGIISWLGNASTGHMALSMFSNALVRFYMDFTTQSLDGSFALPDGNPHLIEITWELATSNDVIMYIDGTQVGSNLSYTGIIDAKDTSRISVGRLSGNNNPTGMKIGMIGIDDAVPDASRRSEIQAAATELGCTIA